jgi:hypothetical protein
MLWLDRIGQEATGDVLATVVEKAKAGDMVAAGLILHRTWPPRRGRLIRLAMPPITSAADLPVALASVLRAVTTEKITPDEGVAVAGLLETARRAIETADMEERLVALENHVHGRNHHPAAPANGLSHRPARGGNGAQA